MSEQNLDKEASKFDAAIAKLMSGTAGARTRKAPRKARAKKIISETDRRHLRATGRVEQWNIRCREGFKEQVQEIADARRVSMAALIEEILEAFIAAETKTVANGEAK
jgi:hypothetical protein